MSRINFVPLIKQEGLQNAIIRNKKKLMPITGFAKRIETYDDIVSMPSNANGQISVTVKGNTETDEEGNTKSTLNGVIKSIGKNLLPPVTPKYYLATGSITNTANWSSTGVSRVWVLGLIPYVANKTYSVQAKISEYNVTSPTGYRLAWFALDKDLKPISSYNYLTPETTGNRVVTATFTTPDISATYLMLALYHYQMNGSYVISDVQLEYGSIATEYESYKETVAYIPNIVLRSLPNNVKDEINVTEGKYIQRIGVDETDPGNPTFTRNSIAYKQDGTQVAANTPRFEQGRFGKAIVVEEGTTNLLEANQSSVETDLTGFTAVRNATLSRDATKSLHGSASLKVTTPGLQGDEGVVIIYSASLSAGQVFNYSVYLAGTGTVSLSILEYNGSILNDRQSVIVNLGSEFKRYDMTYTVTATATRLELRVVTNIVEAKTFWVDGIQLERKPYVTSWTLGGTTRSPETLTIPTAGVLRKGNWIKEIVFIPTSPQNVVGKIGYLWECFINDDNYYALKVGADGKPYLEVKSNGIIYQTSTALAPVLAVGSPYRFAVRGNGSLMALFVNGNKISEVSYVEPVGDLPANMFIGSDHNGANHANGLYDDLRISSIARSDEEILAAYQSGQPLPVDECTAYKLSFDDNLNKERATTLNYQLASPIITKHEIFGDLKVFPSGTIYFEPTLWGFINFDYGQSSKTITTPDVPIGSIRKVIRYDITDDGRLVEVDVTADCTHNGTTLTINNAEPKKTYFYDCEIAPGYSTSAEKIIDVGTHEGVAVHDYGAAAADWVLSTNEALATMLVCINAGGAAKIIAPAAEGKMYIIRNESGQTITIKTASSTGVTVANGKTATVVFYNTDFIKIGEV